MKRLLLIFTILLAFSVPALGAAPVETTPAAEKSELSIPAYPGSTQVMEISLGEKDLLNWFTNVLPAMASMSAGSSDDSILGMINKLDLAGLATALQGLKQIRIVEFTLPKKPDSTVQKITDYYSAQLEKEKGWTRVFWRSEDPKKSMAVYSLPDGEGIFIASAKITSEGGKLLVGRTAGKVDLAKVIEWAAKNADVIQAARKEKK